MHPVADQLRFARSEFLRGLAGLSPDVARVRVGRMNSIGWNVGHLAWQEQRYFLSATQGVTPHPELAALYGFGSPATTPYLDEVLRSWEEVCAAVDPWLDQVSGDLLTAVAPIPGSSSRRSYGSLIYRTIYHYWFHNGENAAIRQQLEKSDLPQFVGDLDNLAPYRAW